MTKKRDALVIRKAPDVSVARKATKKPALAIHHVEEKTRAINQVAYAVDGLWKLASMPSSGFTESEQQSVTIMRVLVGCMNFQTALSSVKTP